jgi:succinate dehydrogenase/fumarate reductase flavoprotein subunit
MSQALDIIRGMVADDLPRMHAADSRPFARELLDALEIANMLEVSEAVVEAALMRTESRGHHFREDYPEADEDWLRHTIVRHEPGKGLVLDTAPVVRLKDRIGAATA